MKKYILAATIAVTALFVATPEANAGPRFSISIGGGSSFSGGHSSGYGRSSHGHRSCDRVYKIRTIELCRHCDRRVVRDSCGRTRVVHVTTVTYKDIYSNGYSRTWNRTFYS